MSAARFLMIAGAPAPVAPFSHAVEVDGWVFLTGQMPTDPNDDGAAARRYRGSDPPRDGQPAPGAEWSRPWARACRGGARLPHQFRTRLWPDERGLSFLFSGGSLARTDMCRRERARAQRAGGDRHHRAKAV